MDLYLEKQLQKHRRKQQRERKKYDRFKGKGSKARVKPLITLID